MGKSLVSPPPLYLHPPAEKLNGKKCHLRRQGWNRKFRRRLQNTALSFPETGALYFRQHVQFPVGRRKEIQFRLLIRGEQGWQMYLNINNVDQTNPKAGHWKAYAFVCPERLNKVLATLASGNSG
jgi:hypothetical protein